MEKEYYMNAGIPTQEQLEPGMQQPWNSFSLPQELNSTSQFTPSCLLNSHWDKQIDHFTQFQSTLGPVVSSSSAVPTSSVLNDSVGIREFIAKLGPNRNSGRNPPPFAQTSSNHHIAKTNGCNAKQQGVSILNEFVKGNLPNSLVLNHPLPALSTDPEFAERAAKFSCFGSRSFNAARTSHSTLLSDVEPTHRSSNAMARVWSSPSLKQSGSPIDNKNSCQTQIEIKKLDRLPSIGQNSNESSSVSEHVPSGETVSKVPSEMHSRKRKSIPKSKAKENVSPTVDSHKVGEADDANFEKRAKTTETSPSENGSISKEDEEEEKAKNGVNEALDEQHKPDIKMNQKPTEPPKDYIHVRARRGQATDSHSLAERVRREKIGERMKLLQDLVPGCNKVTGKALMLDEIINYVQSLQCQVEFLSMKLASVDPRQEVNVDNFSSKDVMQRNGSLPQSFYPVDSSVPGLYGHQPKQYPRMHTDRQSPVEPMHKMQSHELQLPSVNEFIDCLPQVFPAFCEEDLHSIVGMGFGPNAQMEADFIQ